MLLQNRNTVNMSKLWKQNLNCARARAICATIYAGAEWKKKVRVLNIFANIHYFYNPIWCC